MTKIIARQHEIEKLSQLEKSSGAEFVALYGRRRIGKTYLIEQTFKDHDYYFSFTGTKDVSKAIQLNNFAKSLRRQFKLNLPMEPKNWSEALDILFSTIDTKKTKQKRSAKNKNKKIIFFDEVPWLSSKKSGFLEALDYLWNAHLSKRDDVILIICGSAANWMIDNIVYNKGGLHNRLTRPSMHLAPFTLKETRDYFRGKNIDLALEQILEIYMVTGGVAYYLNLYERGMSAAQFVNSQVFSSSGDLRIEFDRLFASLFDRHEVHISIVKELARNRNGMCQAELAKRLKIKTGGTLTKTLTELEKADFVTFVPQLYHQKKEGIYRLTDEYTFFHLTWVEKLGKSFKDSNYWQKQIGSPKYNTWLGLAFEAACFKHTSQLISSLGINGLTTHIYQFCSKMAQVDLIIDRSDKVINLFEMKYTKDPYRMTSTESDNMENRKRAVMDDLVRKKQIFTVLVTPFPAVRNKYYLGSFDQELNLECLFG